MDWKAELLKTLVPLALSALAVAGTWMLKKLANWLDAKSQESAFAKAAAALPHAAEAVWAEVTAELEDEVAKDLADGTLSSEELAQLKADAVEDLKLALKKNGLPALESAFGPLLDGVLTKVIGTAHAKAAPASAASPH